MRVEVTPPDLAAETLGPLIRDLNTCQLNLGLSLDRDDWVILSTDDGSAVGILLASDPSRYRLPTIAERAQDFVIEQRPSAGLPAEWPTCPRHPGSHPLWATTDHGHLGWTCPLEPDLFVPLGQLHHEQLGD